MSNRDLEDRAMYNDLPYTVKKQVRRLLKKNQFPKAKALHDAWMRDQAWHYDME